MVLKPLKIKLIFNANNMNVTEEFKILISE